MKRKHCLIRRATVAAFFVCAITPLLQASMQDLLSATPTTTLITAVPPRTPLRGFFEAAEEKVPRTDASFFSRALTPFIKEHYNAVGYADHLSRDGRDVTEFLALSNDYQFSAEQTYTGLRLFVQRYKDAALVDDTVTNHILEIMPTELERHFPLNPINTSKQKTPAKMIENIMLTELTDHLEAPKKSTDAFFSDLSRTIAASLKETGVSDEMAMKERLRQLATQCAELLIQKTIWYPQYPESIWPSVLKAAHALSQLCSHRIITHADDADALYRSLVSRFIYFIEHSGYQMPVSWYENIQSDIEGGLVLFLESPELDAGITSKKELLMNALSQGKTCAIAQQQHGLVLI